MRRIYRGYVRSDGKSSLDKFKNVPDNQLRTLVEVAGEESYGGVLADNIVLVDIDDLDQSEVVMDMVEQLQLNTLAYYTTRGAHLLFRNENKIEKNRTNAKAAIGIDIDIKLGERNSYQILKKDGVEREIAWEPVGDELDVIPNWLLPVKTDTVFWQMEDGDGRNQAFFNYILTLGSNGFTQQETSETIRLINKHVVKHPVGSDELETILRDEAFEKVDTSIFFEKNTFLHHKFANYLINKHSIKRINGELHVFQDGIYVRGSNNIERAMVDEIPNLRSSQREEVLRYLEIAVNRQEYAEDHSWIAFENGLLNIVTDEFKAHSEQHILTNKIPWNYNPNAQNSDVDTVLNNLACNDDDIRALMQEMIGYTLYRRNELGKAFILIGSKGNGKSTFLDMIINMLGVENVSTLDLNELGERFKTAELAGKLANIGDDIDNEYIKNTGVFKKLATGERINVERKGKDPFDFTNYSKLIFSANSIPRLGKGNDTAALMRRIVIVPFNAYFAKGSDSNFDPYIKYKLRQREAVEYLILLGVKALRDVLENNGFTITDTVEKELEQYEIENNPILEFFMDIPLEEIENHSTKDVYDRYQQWCLANGLTTKGRPVFTKETNEFYGTESVRKSLNGQQVRVFEKK